MSDEIRKIAYEYYIRNRRRITTEIEITEKGIKPSKKIENKPELWDASNWLWYYEH
jgi:hypothetical protein